MKVRMGMPLAEHLGPLGDPLECEGGVHHAFRLAATFKVMRHRTIDPAILPVDEAKVLVLGRTRTINRELLANVAQHFIFEAHRWRRIGRPDRETGRQQ